MADTNDSTNPSNAAVPTVPDATGNATPAAIPVQANPVPSVSPTDNLAHGSSTVSKENFVQKFIADVEYEIKKLESITSLFHVASIKKNIHALIADVKSKL